MNKSKIEKDKCFAERARFFSYPREPSLCIAHRRLAAASSGKRLRTILNKQEKLENIVQVWNVCKVRARHK